MIYRSNVMKAMRILRALSGLALLAAFLSNSRCATSALSTRNADGPVKVFKLGQRIPRNVKILAIMRTSGHNGYSISAGEWGSCSYRQVMWHLKRRARARGADAIAIFHVRKPFGAGGCYRIQAFLLNMIDISNWPRIVQTEEEIRRDLDAGGRTLDDIEGIWTSRAHSEVMMDHAERVAGFVEYSRKRPYGPGVWRVQPSVIQAMEQLSPEEQSSYKVAILKAANDSDYPYAAYILDPEIPEWQAGFLKARLRKLPDSTGYEAKWYGSTFQDDLREFHPDETGALKAKVVVEHGLKYSIEQTLTKVYPSTKVKSLPD